MHYATIVGSKATFGRFRHTWESLPENKAGVHAHSCLTLCDTMDCSPPGSSVHRIFQARTLEQVAISFSRGSS